MLRGAVLAAVVGLAASTLAQAAPITAAGEPAELAIRPAGEHSIRITLKPVSVEQDFPYTPAVVQRPYAGPVIRLREISEPIKAKVGNLNVEVRPSPLTVVVTRADGQPVQSLVFQEDGNLLFKVDGPVLGLGEGGPPARGNNWRTAPVEFDRRGRLANMRPRWQGDVYGSRNPVALMIGTEGWGLFVATPWGEVDLRNDEQGLFSPWKPPQAQPPEAAQASDQNAAGQPRRGGGQRRGQNITPLIQGRPPVDSILPGAYDLFVFDAHTPADLMKDVSVISGPAVMPPKWALGYMQSHRELRDDQWTPKQLVVNVVDTFREKQIPVDAVIYLGTGFTPTGWNTRQPSFTFNPVVFGDNPKQLIDELHGRHVKVVLHMVPPQRYDGLPALQGTIPPQPGETVDASHIQSYWQRHVALFNTPIDAFWPDEGDWFNLFERMARHQMYYQGPLATRPNVRPWSLHRNGHLGVAQWGGWVWSGDTISTWKTLEAQVAVGINDSLSLSPYWGSDTGGFSTTSELTGELYARWFQFSAFCPSFRSHGRIWRLRTPWGWGLADYGSPEGQNDRPLLSEMNNQTIEPVCKKYDQLRYQLIPYTYTLAAEARDTGLPFMRALWLHYPDDEKVRDMGSEYLWGRDILVAPVFTKGATTRDVYLPQGQWYDWWTNAGGGR